MERGRGEGEVGEGVKERWGKRGRDRREEVGRGVGRDREERWGGE